jgi:hypothetical protein
MLALVLLVISIGVGVLSPARFDWVVCVSILVLLGTALLCQKLGIHYKEEAIDAHIRFVCRF